MEIWLKNSRLKFRLPVLPANVYLNSNAKINGEGIVRYGDIAIYGGKGLRKTEIKSRFPKHYDSFCEYRDFPKPYDCVENIDSWHRRGSPVQLIVTGTNINMEMKISDFEHEERQNGDVYYTISLVEHINTSVTTPININEGGSRPSDKSNSNNNTNSSKQRTHKVVKGDNLWDIAQKYYGKGSLYPKIKTANQAKYPSLKKNNVIYPYMTLIIP